MTEDDATAQSSLTKEGPRGAKLRNNRGDYSGPQTAEERITIPIDGWDAEYLFVEDGQGSVRLVGCTKLMSRDEPWRAADNALWERASTAQSHWCARNAFFDQVKDWFMRYDGISHPAGPPSVPPRGRGRPKLTPRQMASRLRNRGKLSDTQYAESRKRARDIGLLTANGERANVIDWLLDLDAVGVPQETVEAILASTDSDEQVAVGHHMSIGEVKRVRVGVTLIRGSLASEPPDPIASMLELRTETFQRVRSGEWGPPKGAISPATRGMLRYVGGLNPEAIAVMAAEKGKTEDELREHYSDLVARGYPSLGEPLTVTEETALAEANAEARARTEKAAERVRRSRTKRRQRP